MLKAIHAQESRDAADRKARAIVDDLRTARMNTAADLVERSVSETLTYYAFPDIHWQKIRTNNPLERIMREIRRRTRVVGAFPDGQSCLNLAAARLRYIVGTAWSTKCYMNMRPSLGRKSCKPKPSPDQMCERFCRTTRGQINAAAFNVRSSVRDRDRDGMSGLLVGYLHRGTKGQRFVRRGHGVIVERDAAGGCGSRLRRIPQGIHRCDTFFATS